VEHLLDRWQIAEGRILPEAAQRYSSPAIWE
jgi:hypothetical protein